MASEWFRHCTLENGRIHAIEGFEKATLISGEVSDTFVVVEKWESLDALKAHAAAPHMAAYAAKVKDMIASRVIHVLSPT